MTLDVKRLRQLAEAATPGPWRWGDSSKERNGVQEKMMNLYSDAPRSDGDVRIIPIVWLEPSSGWNTLHDNTEWIAAANPATILALLDEVERLRGDGATMKLSCMLGLGDPVRPDIHAAVCRERDSLRAEVERLRASHSETVRMRLADDLVHAEAARDRLAMALDEACDLAEQAAAHQPAEARTGYYARRIAALRSIGKDGGNG